LHLHQVVKTTFTFELSNMLGTQRKSTAKMRCFCQWCLDRSAGPRLLRGRSIPEELHWLTLKPGSQYNSEIVRESKQSVREAGCRPKLAERGWALREHRPGIAAVAGLKDVSKLEGVGASRFGRIVDNACDRRKGELFRMKHPSRIVVPGFQ